MLDFHFRAGIIGLDTFRNRAGYASGHAVTSSGSGCVPHLVHSFDFFQQNAFGLKHSRQFLKSNDEIHIGTYRPAAGLQLL